MNYPTWLKRLAWIAGISAVIYFAAMLVVGPPLLARKHPFTWELNFQQNVDRLAANVSSEEEFIEALQRRGLRMWIRPENPMNRSRTSFKDLDRKYTTYAEFVRAHERFQAAFPENRKKHPRIAEASYGFIPCVHEFFVKWHLSGDEIVDLAADDHWACL